MIEDSNVNESMPYVLQADWDMLQYLLKLKQQLRFKAEWIASHQDRKKPLESLSLKAQLNCRADKLAGNQQKLQVPKDITMVHMMPGVATQVQIEGSTITSQHVTKLRNHITTAPLREYTRLKHNWTRETQAKINWSLHESVVSANQSNSYTKFLFRCLPVQNTLHRRHQASTPICCRCKQQDETDEHVIRCIRSDEWREQLYSWYREQIEAYKIDPVLIEIIIQGLWTYIKGHSLRASRFPLKYRIAINEMNEIGWGQWFSSRVSKSLCKLFPTKKKKGSVIKLLLMHTTVQWKALWKSRNKIVHGTDTQARQMKKRDRVNAELTYIYSRRHIYLSKDRDLLFSNLQDHLNNTTSAKQNWLLLYKHYLQESARKYRKISTTGTRRIPYFFKKN